MRMVVWVGGILTVMNFAFVVRRAPWCDDRAYSNRKAFLERWGLGGNIVSQAVMNKHATSGCPRVRAGCVVGSDSIQLRIVG